MTELPPFDPTQPPPLPAEGTEDWHEPLNDCMTWLAQYVTYNNARIADLQGQVSALWSEIANINATKESP